MKILIAILILLLSTVKSFAGFQETPINQPYLYKFVSVATVQTIKTGAGVLHTLTVEGGTAAVINIYDGAVLASAQIASFASTSALATYTLDVGFSSGCTVATSGGLQYTASYL